MYEEIDLRVYVRLLFRNWKWIMGSGVLVAVAALCVSSLLPPVYEASTLIAITKPRYMIQFDPRFETVEDMQPVYNAYPELATSSGLLNDLLSQLDTTEFEVHTIETFKQLQSAVEAQPGDDPSLVHLKVRSKSPEEAATVADLWATLLIETAKSVYGTQNTEQQTFIEEQLELARVELDAAETALVDFESRNRANIIQGKLSTYRNAHMDYLHTLKSIDDLKRDIRGLQVQLQGMPPARPLSLADQLTLVLLQIKVFNVEQETPFEIQISDENTITEGSVDEQPALLKGLLGILDAKDLEIEAELQTLEPEILELQQQLSEMEVEADRLRTQSDVAAETYLTLSRKYAEVRIATEDATDDVKLVSAAVLLDEPVSPKKGVNTVVAGFLGILMSVVVILFLEYWQVEEA